MHTAIMLFLYALHSIFGIKWFERKKYHFGYFLVLCGIVPIVHTALRYSIGDDAGMIAANIFLAVIVATYGIQLLTMKKVVE